MRGAIRGPHKRRTRGLRSRGHSNERLYTHNVHKQRHALKSERGKHKHTGRERERERERLTCHACVE